MNELVALEQQAAVPSQGQVARGRRASWPEALGAVVRRRIDLARRWAARSAVDEEAALAKALQAVERVERFQALKREIDVALIGYDPDPVSGRW